MPSQIFIELWVLNHQCAIQPAYCLLTQKQTNKVENETTTFSHFAKLMRMIKTINKSKSNKRMKRMKQLNRHCTDKKWRKIQSLNPRSIRNTYVFLLSSQRFALFPEQQREMRVSVFSALRVWRIQMCSSFAGHADGHSARQPLPHGWRRGTPKINTNEFVDCKRSYD